MSNQPLSPRGSLTPRGESIPRPSSPEPVRNAITTRPVWVPDTSVTACQGCDAVFSFMTRRHHCRSCGKIFCYMCCSGRIQMPAEFEYDTPQRVCIRCNTMINDKQKAKEKPSEDDALVAQFYLRSVSYDYTSAMFDIGSRRDKRYFKVKNGNVEEVMILASSANCVVPFNSEAKRITFVKLLQSIKHGSIFPVQHVGIIRERQKIVVCRLAAAKGSLRDLIYKASPFKKTYQTKYEVDNKGMKLQGTPLGLPVIQKYGNQILQGLSYLKAMKIPYPHLHTANVMISKDGNCSLSEIENTLLGLVPFLQPYFKSSNVASEVAISVIEVTCFGHVLFEMAMGYAKQSTEVKEIKEKCPPKIYDILESIFPETGEPTTTIEDLLSHPFFANQFPSEQFTIAIDNKMITMIKWVRESTPKVLNSTLPAPQLVFDEKKPVTADTKSKSTTDLRKPEPVTPTTSAPPPPPAPNAPVPPPAPAVSQAAPTTGRNALLDSIRNPENMKKLKKKN